MILWGFLDQLTSEPFSEVISGPVWEEYLLFLDGGLLSTKGLSFDVQLMFPFVIYAFGVISKKPWSIPGSRKCTSVFSSVNGIVLALMFRSVIISSRVLYIV